MFLCKIVCKGSLARALWSNNYYIELILFLNWIWILHLKSIFLLLCKCSLSLSLLLREFISSNRYLLLSSCWSLFTIRWSCFLFSFLWWLLQSLLFFDKSGELFLNLSELTFNLLCSPLFLILLFERWPEFATWCS